MPDDDLYTLVRNEFEPVRMQHSLQDVTARGRGLRGRRRAVSAVAAVAVAVALAAALVPIARAEQPLKSSTPLQLAAWSVDTRPGGLVVVTIRQLTDAEELTTALKEAGVPALIEFKQIPAARIRKVGCENRQPALPQLDKVIPTQDQQYDGAERVLTINRAEMPTGSSMHFVIINQISDGGASVQSVQISLVQGNPMPCVVLK